MVPKSKFLLMRWVLVLNPENSIVKKHFFFIKYFKLFEPLVAGRPPKEKVHRPQNFQKSGNFRASGKKTIAKNHKFEIFHCYKSPDLLVHSESSLSNPLNFEYA